MTLSALGVVAVYAGSGSTGPFSLTDAGANPILFQTNSEIIVSKYTNPDDTHPTVLTITTDYTLTGAGLGTPGAVTLVLPLAVGETLLIQRVTASTQALDLIFGGDLSLENLEAELDKQIRLIQELREQVNRSLQFPAIRPTLASSQTRMVPVPSAGAVLAWSSDASRLVNATGHLFLSGAGAPSVSLGGEGDFYLDTVTKILYGPKTGGLWSISFSLVGPQGIQGIQGAQGIPGPSGPGTGNFNGPAGATDNAVVRFDLATGTLGQNSVVLIGDTGAVTGVLSIDLPNAGLLLRDTNASHTLQISPGSNITANRIFTLTTGDANRTLNISAADVTVSAFAATYLDDTDAATTRTTIGAGDVVGPAAGVVDNEFAFYNSTTGKIIKGSSLLKASIADVRAAVANRVMTTDLIETASALVTLTDAATIAVDWDAGINFIVTLTANRALGNPTNQQVGTWRTIRLLGDSGTPRTLTFGANYVGAVPTLADISTTKQYILSLFCYASGFVMVQAAVSFP